MLQSALLEDGIVTALVLHRNKTFLAVVSAAVGILRCQLYHVFCICDVINASLSE